MKNKAENVVVLSSVEQYRSALETNAVDLSAHVGLGWALHHAGESVEAIDVLQKARKRFPDDIELLYALGLMLKQTSRNKEASAVFKDLLKIKESSTSAAKASMFRHLAGAHLEIL